MNNKGKREMEILKKGNNGWQSWICMLDAGWSATVKPAIFAADYYAAQARPVSHGGRNSSWYIPTPLGPGVLRRYTRGGLLSRIVKQQYLWLGAQKSRAFREFLMLDFLHQNHLRVPKPYAAFVAHCGFLSQMAIITQLIEDSKPLAVAIQDSDETLIEQLAQKCAQAIAHMHQLCVWHADLNAFNIMVDVEQQIWLIDFDKSRRLNLNQMQRQQNLHRLRRSLIKIHNDQGLIFWERVNAFYNQFLKK